MNDLKDGYYWVETEGDVIIVEYDSDEWYYIGGGSSYPKLPEGTKILSMVSEWCSDEKEQALNLADVTNCKNIWYNCYKMKLGDKITIAPNKNSIEELQRVPGGWIHNYGDMQGTTSVFVPYNNEFQ